LNAPAVDKTWGLTMSTDPTQPMSPSAPAGSGRPQEQEPRERDGGRPDPEQSPAVPPTRVQPAAEQVAPTRVQPSFQPARNSPQPGWPPAGGAPGSGDAGAYGEVPEPGGPHRGRAGQNAYPGYPGIPAPRPRRRRRRWVMALFALIVVLILLTIGDRVALAVAENQFASQAVANGMPVKPSVTIEGFPFLTQLVARDFRRVDISANNIPAGPVDITSVKATLNGMHLNSSFNGATVDHITATAFMSFSALTGGFGSSGTGITITAAGPNTVNINAGGLLNEQAKIIQTGPNEISVQVQNNGDIVSGLLNSLGSFSFSIPKLPVAVHIQKLSVTPQGLILTATADHANLSKPSS
jgi:hypothetical protein